MKKTNVLHIIYKYNDNLSDINLTYLKALDTNEFYNVVVVLQGGRPNFLVDSKNINYIFYDKGKIKGTRFDLIRKVIGVIRSYEIDVIISHRYKALYVAMFVNIFCSVKKIYSVVHRMGEFKSRTRKTLANLLCRKNHTIIGVSDAVSNDLRKNLWRLSPGNILTIHNALNIADLENSLLNRNEALDVLGISENNFIFGTIGRLVPVKGHIYLLEAFALIKDKYPEALLVIIGGGRLARDLYAKADELGLNGRVVFTGRIENAARLLLSFDTFVLSSLEEGLALVLLEAMIAKLPIISTNSGGIPEVLGNETEMVMPGDPKALSKKMIEHLTISREERLNRGNILYQRAVTLFGNQVLEQKLVSLIVG
jgi:glycosyltransferase involved in cell wall biosynthesis